MILHDRLVEATEISPMRQRWVKWNPKKAPHAVGVMQKHAVIINRPCGGMAMGRIPDASHRANMPRSCGAADALIKNYGTNPPQPDFSSRLSYKG